MSVCRAESKRQLHAAWDCANLPCISGKGGIFEAGFGEKVALSWPSVNRFGKFLGGLMTLGQVKSVPNFC